jgi:hypothetical protein
MAVIWGDYFSKLRNNERINNILGGWGGGVLSKESRQNSLSLSWPVTPPQRSNGGGPSLWAAPASGKFSDNTGV